MLKHLVLWKLKDPSEENLKKLQDLLNSMRKKIPFIIHVEAGINIDKSSDSSYDIAIYSTFAGPEAFHDYLNHPYHLEVAETLKQYVSETAKVDYIYK